MTGHTNERVIGTVPLGSRSELRVTLSVTDEGWERLDLRQWWLPEGEADMQPSQKGINIPAHKRQALIEALSETQAKPIQKPMKARKRRNDKAWAKREGRKHGIYVGDDPEDELPPWL